MTTTLARPSQAEQHFFSVTPDTVAPMAERFLLLKINGLNDVAGRKAVHEARMQCVKARTTTEREHKHLKADALAECQRIDKAKRDTLALIAPVEKYLEDQEQAISNEKARIQKDANDRKYAERMSVLTAAGGSIPEITLRQLSDEDFVREVDLAIEMTRFRKLEEEQKAVEAEKFRLERVELDRQRAELEEQRKAQEAEAARLRKIEEDRLMAEQAERDRIAEEEAATRRKVEMERVQMEAAEKSRVETEHRIERERAAAEQKARDDEASRQRQEAMRPDREKLMAVATAVASIKVPEVGESFAVAANRIAEILVKAESDIRVAVNAAK